MSTTPTTEPTSVRAGDTWSWTITEADYAGYSLTYYLRNATDKIDISTTASGTLFTVSVAAATTTAYKPGRYSWIRRVSGAGGTFTTATGEIEVFPNLATAFAQDTRSHARKVLDAINALLEGRATSDVSSYSIAGRSISKMSVAELLAWQSKYTQMVSSEIAADRLSRGLGTGRKIVTRF